MGFWSERLSASQSGFNGFGHIHDIEYLELPPPPPSTHNPQRMGEEEEPLYHWSGTEAGVRAT